MSIAWNWKLGIRNASKCKTEEKSIKISSYRFFVNFNDNAAFYRIRNRAEWLIYFVPSSKAFSKLQW